MYQLYIEILSISSTISYNDVILFFAGHMPTKRIFVPDLDDSDDLLAYLTDVARNTVLPEDLDKALPDYQFLTWVQNSSNADKMTVRIEYMSTNASTCIVRYLISYIQSPQYIVCACLLVFAAIAFIVAQLAWRCYADDISTVTSQVFTAVAKREANDREEEVQKKMHTD
jgi:hypothetical protein